MPNTNRHIAFMVRSSDYIASAEALLKSAKNNELGLNSDDPIDQLVGHGFEIALKARLLQIDPTANVRKYNHNILTLYDHLIDTSAGFAGISTVVENSWRDLLLHDRRQVVKTCGSFASALNELGLPTEQEITDTPIDLRIDVEWYSMRMETNGNLFRYHQTRVDSWRNLRFCGQDYHCSRQSLIWAAKLINAGTGTK